MLGTGLQKLAAELGFRISDGVAYGEYNGYMLALRDGMSCKLLSAAISFGESSDRNGVYAFLSGDYANQHRVSTFNVTASCISVTFVDTVGTIKKIREFMDGFTGDLHRCGVNGTGFCNRCSREFSSEDPAETVFFDGSVLLLHHSCADELIGESAVSAAKIKEEGNGVAAGAVGAVLGALIGAIPWAVAYYFGWFVAVLGILIGLGAIKGYELFKGQETKAKVVAVTIASLFAVIFVEFVMLVIFAAIGLADGSTQSVLACIPSALALFPTLITSPDVLPSVIVDIVLGCVFAGIGFLSPISKIFSKTSSATAVPHRL